MTPLPPPHPSPHGPSFAVPPLACDAHCHIFGPEARFPYQSPRAYQPAETPLERYQATATTLGLTRAVFVQPAVYGTDHAAMLDAIARGEGCYRGVGIVGNAADFTALHAGGIRGARFNFVGHLGGSDIGEVRDVAQQVASLDWHIVLHINGAALVQHFSAISELPCDFVIDHMARLTLDDDAGFERLLDLAAHPRCWVKISAADRMAGAPERLPQAAARMAALADAAPTRTLWGTDWPHPNVAFMPDDGDLLDLLAAAVPDATARHAILVDNPARLYDFGGEDGQ